MEFLHETIALGVDLLILGLCVKEYVSYKKNVNCLKAAPQLAIDGDLKKYVASQKDKKIPYAVVRGTVTPIGVPMRSVMSPSVTGVLQVIKLSEHRVTRGFAGFWTEQRKLIHVSSNEMPFELRNNESSVEIIDALSAAVLDMDVVYDNYEPSSLSFFDHVFGFFSGVRQKGLQTTEEVLRDGSFITAIGELELDGKTLRLQPSPVGPLFLTTATKSTLIKKFEEAKSSMLVKIFVCGTISAFLIGFIVRKLYAKKKQERDERKIKETLEKERRERRARTRPLNLTTEQLCVVCSTNPKEVIILPCGHVCICEDCSEKIRVTCPVCRGKIVTKAAAFIA
ncbi:mitochondrial E3 ubiquitin protein ligase 1 [Rhagoletis pomonella]|uniref:mitochondrial E3 ubiquitin protein ligase 1 n=1 Tax=Rhagoletis pomonella TaxID=28610 RepID=UPI001787629A|nr:mitochondrial E3 ubiquitin protein ligase 1 [Rhagoletis pomonella]